MPSVEVDPAISVTTCVAAGSSGLCTRSMFNRRASVPIAPVVASMESECVRTSDSRPPSTTPRPRVARMSPPAFLIVVVPTGLSIVPLSRISDDPRFSISIVVGVTVRSIAKVSETLSVPPTRSTCGSPPDVTGTILLICRFFAEALTIRIFSTLSENFQVPPLPEITSA